MKIKEYKSKYDNYDLGQRFSDLKSIVELQCDPDNALADEYNRGLANGLLMAWNIVGEPYGHQPEFICFSERKKDTCPAPTQNKEGE